MLIDTACAGLVVTLIGLIRSKYKKLDGAYVPLVATPFCVLFAWLVQAGDLHSVFRHGLMIGGIASGGMTALGYHATKSGEAIGQKIAASLPPPASSETPILPTIPPVPPPPRGFISFEAAAITMIVIAAGTLVYLVFFMLPGCAPSADAVKMSLYEARMNSIVDHSSSCEEALRELAKEQASTWGDAAPPTTFHCDAGLLYQDATPGDAHD